MFFLRLGEVPMLSQNLKALLVAAAALGVTACATHSNTEATTDTKEVVAEVSPMEIYEVHHDGRINVFYDRPTFKSFQQVGETIYRLTKIGSGPNGETIVYGLTKADKKKPEKVDAIKLYEGKMEQPANFYAEMVKHGRIYIFDNFADMKPVRDFGHPNFFYTEIGAGPKGETVVYVLNSKTKKKRPDALIAKYKAMQAN